MNYKVIYPLLLLVWLTSCGGTGSDLPKSKLVTVTLSPISTTVDAGGTVTLQAQSTGFTAAPILQWWMKEQHDAYVNGSFDCDGINANNQELIPTCKFGYIVVSSMQTYESTAIYHAPQTIGTYHVTFRAVQVSTDPFGGSVEKLATATIIVR